MYICIFVFVHIYIGSFLYSVYIYMVDTYKYVYVHMCKHILLMHIHVCLDISTHILLCLYESISTCTTICMISLCILIMFIRLSSCINAFVFCVHYLCLIGRVYVFYVGHVDKSLYDTIFHCNILSKHHHI
jgi:hypothetical protein